MGVYWRDIYVYRDGCTVPCRFIILYFRVKIAVHLKMCAEMLILRFYRRPRASSDCL